MTLFLTSSPCIPNADRAILNPANGFVQHIRAALPPKPRCLFICSDPDSAYLTDRFAQDMSDAFTEAGMPFSHMDVLDGRNAEQAAQLVGSSQFIILAGGHVPTQNRFLRQYRIDLLLRGYTGVIMGVSAGSMNAASLVYAQPEMAGESIDPHYQRFLPGLGLTHVMLLPHYQMEKDTILDGKRLYEDITYADSMGRVFYVLPDGSYLYGHHGKTILMGECYCIHSGVLEKLAADGEQVTLI